MGAHVQVYNSFESILKEAFGYRNTNNIMLSYEWFSLQYQHCLGPAWKPRIYVVLGVNGDYRSALFCVQDKKHSRLFGLTTCYSIEFDLVTSSDDCAADLELLFDYISAEEENWRLIELQYLLQDAQFEASLIRSPLAEQYVLERYFQYGNWCRELDDRDFVALRAELPSRVRNTIARKTKAVSKEFDLRVDIYSENDPGLPQALNDYKQIYDQSWKNEELSDEFIVDLIKCSAEFGSLRLGILYLNDKPVSFQLWILSGDRAVIYKLAYDEAFKKFSVGTILSDFMFDKILAEGRIRRIDYGIGDEPYKLDWMEYRRVRIGYQLTRKASFSGVLAALRVSAKKIIKF